MGGVGEDRQSRRRVTVDEAARHLGLTVDAVRKRVQREQIAYDKDEAGRVRIILNEGETLQDESPDTTGQDAGGESALMEELRRTNDLLREVITTRDEEIRRRDTIIMNMTEAMKALNPPAPEDSEVRESPESSGPAGELGEIREELVAERDRREMAENTLREGMAEEQRRREEAERERDDLLRELHALREPRQSPETGEEHQGGGEPRSYAPDAQAGVQRRPWWRRVFGG